MALRWHWESSYALAWEHLGTYREYMPPWERHRRRTDLISPVELRDSGWYFTEMRKSDVTCPKCRAGYRRIEVASGKTSKGEYRCLLCDHLLELFDGSSEVAIRLTVQPEKIRDGGDNPFSN